MEELENHLSKFMTNNIIDVTYLERKLPFYSLHVEEQEL